MLLLQSRPITSEHEESYFDSGLMRVTAMLRSVIRPSSSMALEKYCLHA